MSFAFRVSLCSLAARKSRGSLKQAAINPSGLRAGR